MNEYNNQNLNNINSNGDIQPNLNNQNVQPNLNTYNEQPHMYSQSNNSQQGTISTFNDSNIENRYSKGGNNKKVIILGGVSLVIVGLIIGIILLFNPSSKTNGNSKDKMSENNVEITGSVKFLQEYDADGFDVGLLEIESAPYISQINKIEGWQKVLDKDGKVLFTLDLSSFSTVLEYIADGYFIDNNFSYDKFQIIDYKGKTRAFDTMYSLTYYYKDGILYAPTSEAAGEIQAYDLKNDKVLWVAKGSNPFMLGNGKIVSQTHKYNQEKKIIDAKTGKILVEKPSKDETLYATESYYYVVTEHRVEVYDYNNKKISSYDLINDEKQLYTFSTALSNGGFIINIYDRENRTYRDKIFNKKSEEILTIDDGDVTTESLYSYSSGGVAKKNTSTKYSIVFNEVSYRDFLTYVIYDDDTISKLYSTVRKNNYLIGFTDFNEKTLKIINLETKKEKELKEHLTTFVDTPENNNYFIINANSVYDKEYEYYVYNKNFEKIYSTKNSVYSVNDEYFLEIDSKESGKNDIYLINQKTLKKTLLETKGLYRFHNANNLVTYDGNEDKQWLYKFD